MQIRLTIPILPLLLLPLVARAGEEPDRKEIAAFFVTLKAAIEDEDYPALSRLVDCGRLCDEVLRLCGQPRLTGRTRALAVRELEKTIAAKGETLMLDSWDRSEILRVTEIEEGREYLVLRRALYAGRSARERWRLSRDEGGGWRFFDYENVGFGMGVIASTAVVVGELGELDYAAKLRVRLAFSKAIDALAIEDSETAREWFTSIEDLVLPPRIDAFRRLLHAFALVDLAESDRALAEIEIAAEQFPDLPAVLLIRATALCDLGRHEQARQISARYRLMTDGGPEGLCIEGRALAGLGLTEEARKLLFDGMNAEPGHEELVYEWGRLLLPDEKGELAKRFEKLPDAADRFEEFANAYYVDEDLAAVLALVGVQRRLSPKDPWADYYEALVLSDRGDGKTAAKLLLGTIPRAKDAEDRRWFEEIYLDEMLLLKKPIHALLSFPGDKAWAFEYLAAELLDMEEWVKLIALVEYYRETGAEDLSLLFYSGRTHEWNGFGTKAEVDYAAGAKRAVTPEERERFREALVRNRFHEGKGLSAYVEFGPRAKTFRQLAGLFSDEGDGPGLDELIEVHREAGPHEPTMHYWEMEAAWLAKDYEIVAKLFRRHGAAILAREDGRWRPEDRIVRALVRLGRLDEAMREAVLIDRRQGDPWYATMVHAVRGDADAVLAGIAGILKAEYTLAGIYGDEDLGPALEGEKMEKVREKYPPPKED